MLSPLRREYSLRVTEKLRVGTNQGEWGQKGEAVATSPGLARAPGECSASPPGGVRLFRPGLASHLPPHRRDGLARGVAARVPSPGQRVRGSRDYGCERPGKHAACASPTAAAARSATCSSRAGAPRSGTSCCRFSLGRRAQASQFELVRVPPHLRTRMTSLFRSLPGHSWFDTNR
jgi:hypothetical protein